MPSPIVSVLMTAYNRESFIAEAIESVLSSTLSDFELIVVDDCSIDNTIEIAKVYAQIDRRVKIYINGSNLGDYKNRNKAATYATGKYIKYLDSDDIMYPHCLQVMVTSMEAFKDAGFGLSAVPDPLRRYPVALTPSESYHEHFFGYGHFDRAPSSSIIRKEAFEAVGGFSGKRMIGDYEFWLKISKSYNLVKFERDLVWDRWHVNQESQSHYAKSEYNRLRKEVLREALDQKDCPLTDDKIKSIKRKLVMNYFKKLIWK